MDMERKLSGNNRKRLGKKHMVRLFSEGEYDRIWGMADSK
jgi:hypothetical protein